MYAKVAVRKHGIHLRCEMVGRRRARGGVRTGRGRLRRSAARSGARVVVAAGRATTSRRRCHASGSRRDGVARGALATSGRSGRVGAPRARGGQRVRSLGREALRPARCRPMVRAPLRRRGPCLRKVARAIRTRLRQRQRRNGGDLDETRPRRARPMQRRRRTGSARARGADVGAPSAAGRDDECSVDDRDGRFAAQHRRRCRRRPLLRASPADHRSPGH